jgi:hypothetical protein
VYLAPSESPVIVPGLDLTTGITIPGVGGNIAKVKDVAPEPPDQFIVADLVVTEATLIDVGGTGRGMGVTTRIT